MKKRLFALTLVVILLFSFLLAVPSFAEQVTAVSAGSSNVEFSNGYRGYCIDEHKDYADIGDIFETSDTSIATSNVDGSDISQYLKALFVVKFNDLFVSDGNGGYVLDFDKKDSLLPSIIWNFSDNRYIWGDQKTMANEVKAYTGPAIPDEGHTITLDNGDVITFYFLVMHPENTDKQDFFSYKIEVGQEESTTETTTESTTAETTTETTTESTTAESTTETTTESTTAESTTETTTESTTVETTTETTTESTTAETTTETTTESTTAESTTETTTESTTQSEESSTNSGNNSESGGGGGSIGGGTVMNPPGGDTSDGSNPDGSNPDGNNPDGNSPEGSTPEGNSPDSNKPDSNNPDKNADIPNTDRRYFVKLWLAVAIISMGGIAIPLSNKKRNKAF